MLLLPKIPSLIAPCLRSWLWWLATEYGLSHINFRAPNLKCLHQHYRKMISKYSSAGLENLREYSFRLSGDPPMTRAEAPNVVDVLSSLHKIEKFSVAKYFIMVIFEFSLALYTVTLYCLLLTSNCFLLFLMNLFQVLGCRRFSKETF